MSFSSGHLCRLILAAALAFGVSKSASAEEKSLAPVAVFLEIIEVEKADAFQAAAEHRDPAGDASALRKAIEKQLDAGKARLLESQFTRLQPGEEVAVRSVEEFIYGTEGDPPETPNDLKLGKTNLEEFRGTPGNFAAFETRNLGIDSDFEVAAPQGDTITLNCFAKLTTHLFDHFFGRSAKMHPKNELQHKSMPRIKSLKVSHQFELKHGKPILASMQQSIPYREEGKPAKKQDDSRRVLVFLTAWVLK